MQFLSKVIALLIALISCSPGHVVEQFFIEIIPNEKSWKLEVLFDVGYATAEGRADIDSPAPTRDWLTKRTPEEHEALRAGTENYLRECLSFSLGEEPLQVGYHFGDFDHHPPDFFQNVVDGAYYRVTISPRADHSFDEVRCQVAEGPRPNFVFARNTTDARPEYFTARPGEKILIAERGQTSALFVFKQGFEHVIPLGIDHILFILALFLATRRLKFLLQQSLVFTVAHSITLGLAAAGFITPSPTWVEPLIALSIIFLAVENLWLSNSSPRRFLLIFFFGLLHGLGFAAVLQKYLAGEGQFLKHLALANLGVELAQIVVLATAWLLTMKWHRSNYYRPFTTGANLILIIVASWWFIERI